MVAKLLGGKLGQIGDVLREYFERGESRDGVSDNPFRLVSELDQPGSTADIVSAWPGQRVPAELSELWLTCREAALFRDADYGQWGLLLLSPSKSSIRTALERRERPIDIRPDDFVIGEFLGDQELLIYAPSEDASRRVLVALPLDPRSDWYGVGDTVAAFLRLYLANLGKKYWELD